MFLATFVQCTFGFGNALMAMPLLAFLVPLSFATPLVALVSMTVTVGIVAADWRHMEFGAAARLVIGAVFGIPLGIWLLTSLDERIVKGVLAVVILSFAALQSGPSPPISFEKRPLGRAVRLDCGRSGRSLQHARAALGDLRVSSRVVDSAISRDLAGLFSVGGIDGAGFACAGGVLDESRALALCDVLAVDRVGVRHGARVEPPHLAAAVSKTGVSGLDRHCLEFADKRAAGVRGRQPT